MAKSYHTRLEVRGYELDSFGHVNHAVYLSYLEHARWEMLTREGITLQKFNEWKRWPVVANIEIAYLKPTFLGEQLDVETHVLEHGRSFFTFQQTVSRGGTAVLKAKVRAVMVDERGKPSAFPDRVSRLWTESPGEEPASP